MKIYADDALIEAIENGARQIRQVVIQVDSELQQNPRTGKIAEIIESQLDIYERQARMLEDIVEKYKAKSFDS